MVQGKIKLNILTGNALKLIAGLSMLLDHIGAIFFPRIVAFRIIGRIAFPIFAFMIAEGARYTKNKLKYFSLIFILAVACQLVYFVVEQSLFMSVLVSFSISILIIYVLHYFKKQLKGNSLAKKLASGLILAIFIGVVFVVNKFIIIDYGFWGCMMPVFASVFHIDSELKVKKLDYNFISVIFFSIGLILLCIFSDWDIQYFSLLSIPLLLLYSGKRGKFKMKYFFYIFYPLHLAVLYGISMILMI